LADDQQQPEVCDEFSESLSGAGAHMGRGLPQWHFEHRVRQQGAHTATDDLNHYIGGGC
jgi:hypothetical protein